MAPLSHRLTDTAARLLLKSASVTDVVEHGPFRTIDLVGRAFEGVEWVAGDKLRVHADGLALRTYTPTMWDAHAGRTQLIAFVHGDSPGARWCRQAAVEVTGRFLGPQHSVRLDHVGAAPMLVGDETSIGLVVAWRTHRPDAPPAAILLEVTTADAVGPVLDHHQLAVTELVERQPDDAHLDRLAALVADQVRAHPAAPLCLTGRAQTIAVVRRHLRAAGLSASDTRAKAYWDLNRSGLD